MRHDALGSEIAVPELLLQLSKHLRNTGSKLPTAQALDVAIRAWMAADQSQTQTQTQTPPTNTATDPAKHSRGYQWKTLFLPDSTELRMQCAGTTFYGNVVGDDIIYGGRSVSPRGMTVAIAGDGRNAWRDLSLLLPGERCWKNANRCRRDQERALAAPSSSSSPVVSMAAAAAAMSEALKTSLALVQHCNSQTMPKVDRRGPNKHRRQTDLLGEDSAFD